jgi:hypothetical protein
MGRFLFAALLATAIASITGPPALAQVVQYQFAPPPPIVPLPQHLSAPLSVPDVAEPVPAPPIARTEPQIYTPSKGIKPLRSQSPRFVWAGRRMVPVPPVPPHSDYATRLQGCLQAGTAAGVPSSRLGGFGARCAQ